LVPDLYAQGHAMGNRGVLVTIRVDNTVKTGVAGGPAGRPRVNDADGASAELVIDGSGRQKVIDGYLLPGRQVVGKYAFSLPPDAADKAEVEFGTDLSEADYSYWSGPLHLGS
ncbi:hypothetical protein ACH4KX_37055, partial [Streptomyces rimosus]